MKSTHKILAATLLLLSLGIWTGCEKEEPSTTKPAEQTDKDKDQDQDQDKDTDKDNPEPEPEIPVETVVYYDNLDKVISTSNKNYFDTWTECRNMEGSGIDGVTYTGNYSSVRNTFVSTGYPGASGNNGVYYHREGSYTSVNGISLPKDAKVFKLSVGLHSYSSDTADKSHFSISISDKSGKSYDLDYTASKYGKWYLASAVFEIESSEAIKLNIKISANATGAQGRSDDLKLATTTETPTAKYAFGTSSGQQKSGCIEKPQTLKASSDYKYITHYATTYTSHKYVRNYSACYDTRRHNPMWVAYPCHDIYWEGGYKRPVKDPWRPDPEMTESEQSIIYASDWDGWPWSGNDGNATDKYQYWSSVPTGKYTSRGHLMRSAERGCGDSSTLLDLNTQTFYPTNIAPELYVNVTSENSHWSQVENILPNKWRCSDTVYVVVGCWYGDDSWKVYDAVNGKNTSVKSKQCIMPQARYKIVMRTKSGSTGKAIWECRADEVMAIGFWFPQSFTGEVLDELPPLSDYIYSVSDIEKKIGGEFSFFPLAPEGVKDSYKISDWPGLEDIAN